MRLLTPIPADSYEYDSFPRLDESRFGAIREVKPLVKQQRYRPVSTMARRVNKELMKGNVTPQFQSWERLRRSAISIQTAYRR